MKTLLTIITCAVVVTACDVYVVEPRYDQRDALVGYYYVEEYSDTYYEYFHYSISINKGSAYDQVWLHNFYDVDISVRAYVDGNRITIPFQRVDGYEVEGVGTIHTGDIHLSYTVYDVYQGGPTDYCAADYWQD